MLVDLIKFDIVTPTPKHTSDRSSFLSRLPIKPGWPQDEDEERKKGAIRKRPPPLQEPASRPPSSFIMDDVLYTSR